MRIALEGVDGTGKTTISEKLANKLGCNIVRLTNGGDRSHEAYRDLMSCENVVHDRTFISEIIYPKYFGRESRLKYTFIPALYMMMDRFDIKTFVLTASNETILERIRARGDEFISDESLFAKINNDYLRIAREMKFTVIDTTNKTIDEIVEEIGGYVHE